MATSAPLRVGHGEAPSLAVDAAGNAVVAWQHDKDVLARRILVDGRTIDVNVAFDSGGNQDPFPRVASAEDGRFAVAWTAPHVASFGVYVALYTPQGGLRGEVHLASPRTEPISSFPQIAFAPDGASFLVAWAERPASGPPFPGTEIYARAFDGTTCAPLGPDVKLSLTAFDFASVGRIVPVDGGRFAVLWAQVIRRGPVSEHVAVVGGDGALVSGSFLLTSHGSASLVATSSGFSAWIEDLLDDEGWFERRFAADGTPQGIGGHLPLEACTGGFVGGARTAADRDELRCMTQGGREFPSTLRELLVGPVGDPLAAVLVVPCDDPVSGCGIAADLPAAYPVAAGGTTASAFQLVWETGEDVFLHVRPPTFAGYVRFDTPGTTVKAGETAFLRVARTTPADGAVTVRWSTHADGGGAHAGEDFVNATGSVRWEAGETGTRAIEVETRTDGDGRDGESFSVVLEDVSGGALYGAPTSHRVTLADDPRCVAEFDTLCLAGGRFAAQVRYTQPLEGGGTLTSFGVTEPYSEDTGFFWFDDPRNLEIGVKVLNFGDTFKVFYAQLTDFTFDLAVTDLYTGETRTYHETPGNCGGMDEDFADLGRLTGAGSGKALAGACAADALCLQGGRFEVRVEWRNPYDPGSEGVGRPDTLSDLTGLFAFGNKSNVELVVKVLDFGERVLLLSGAMTDFEYNLTVRDTTNGAIETYHNPPRNYCGVFDPAVF